MIVHDNVDASEAPYCFSVYSPFLPFPKHLNWSEQPFAQQERCSITLPEYHHRIDREYRNIVLHSRFNPHDLINDKNGQVHYGFNYRLKEERSENRWRACRNRSVVRCERWGQARLATDDSAAILGMKRNSMEPIMQLLCETEQRQGKAMSVRSSLETMTSLPSCDWKSGSCPRMVV